ncbi:MAG: trypsin-like serine protease [Proteobacteria bacterium]|nr:trypsin-like serine protease [Pseudomonadota bacterium]MCP4920136.1 trypsin-like serine protease [Pseudomonadota bacterium]
MWLSAVLWSGLARAEPDVEVLRSHTVRLTNGPGLCAGVLVDDQGTIATAYHCVSTGRRTKVETYDGVEAVARLVSTDPRNDLALLHADELAGRAHAVVRRDSVAVGETVWAVGHPYGTSAMRGPYEGLLNWSVTRGIASASGPRLLQVDAALNPGNSGGPLFDDDGQVVGIASRKLRADNIAFAGTGELVGDLMDTPYRKLPGGSYGVGLAIHLPSNVASATSIGVTGHADLRDSLVLSVGGSIPVGQRWQAAAVGESRWVLADMTLSGRARFGRGAWSTAIDLGGGALVQGHLAASIEDTLRMTPGLPTLLPVVQARIELGGSALRWMVVPRPGAVAVGISVDIGFPGTLGAF